MLDVVVKRSEWLRGEGSDVSSLCRAGDGRKCCLGFAELALGVPVEDILNRTTPRRVHVDDSLPQWPDQSYIVSPEFNSPTVKMMDVNDAKEMDEDERELKLTELGAKVGINFTFVD